MSHVNLCFYPNSPPSICDAFPLSFKKRGGTDACGRGVSSKITNRKNSSLISNNVRNKKILQNFVAKR